MEKWFIFCVFCLQFFNQPPQKHYVRSESKVGFMWERISALVDQSTCFFISALADILCDWVKINGEIWKKYLYECQVCFVRKTSILQYGVWFSWGSEISANLVSSDVFMGSINLSSEGESQLVPLCKSLRQDLGPPIPFSQLKSDRVVQAIYTIYLNSHLNSALKWE